MDLPLFEQLHKEGHVSDSSLDKIKARQTHNLFSLHWELKTILYLGVMLFSGGLGILIYKNIDTIGHQVILWIVGAVSAGSFFYCFKSGPPFTNRKAVTVNSFFDYILLLGCLSLLTFIGYLQFQYQVFGERYGLATFIPMVWLFFCAYYFDHLGVLSMAIVNLGAWAGIALTPGRILTDNQFSSQLIFKGLLLSFVLLSAGYLSKLREIKSHFEFTYTNFGTHLLFISCLAGMFHFDSWYILWLAAVAGIAIFYYRKARKEKSFYYILLLTLYGFIGLSYVVLKLLFDVTSLDIGAAYLACLYFIAAATGMIMFLVRTNRKFKTL